MNDFKYVKRIAESWDEDYAIIPEDPMILTLVLDYRNRLAFARHDLMPQ